VAARPGLLVLALGVGAERGAWVGAAAMAIAVALLAGLVAWCPTDGPAGRVLRWASRLLGTALIASGVILATDGVLDV
jgi:hypothetical protein